MLSAIAIVSLYTLTGFVTSIPTRTKVFGHKWMNRNFKKEHQEAFGDKTYPGDMGHPDDGNGRYAMALSYSKWH